MKLLVKLVAICLLSTLLKSSEANRSPNQELWTLNCKENACESALLTAVDSQCLGKNSCREVVERYYPVCLDCVDKLLDGNTLESVSGEQYLACDEEDRVQTLGCSYYCRVKFYSYGVCSRFNDLPVCQCFGSGSSTSTTQTSSASRTTSTTMSTTQRSTTSDTTRQTESTTRRSTTTSDMLIDSIPLRTLTGHTDSIKSLLAMQNGDLVSASFDSTIRIWNPYDGTLKTTLPTRISFVYSLVELQNGDLAIASFNGIDIWSAENNSLRTLSSDTVLALAVMQNGDLVSGSADNAICIWDANDLSLKKILIENSSVYALAILHNGDMACGFYDGTIKIFSPNGMFKRKLTGHMAEIQSLILLKNGYLASASYDNTIKIWNPEDGTLRRTLDNDSASLMAITVLANGDLVCGSNDNVIKIWNPNDGTLKRTIIGHTKGVWSLAALNMGLFASGSADSTIKIWSLA